MSRFENWADKNEGYALEGESGVKNLCRFVRSLGYADSLHRMQLSHDASVGDLLDFFADNPGAIEAVIDFVDEHAKSYPDENGDCNDGDDYNDGDEPL